MTEIPDESYLIKRLKSGDDKAFGTIFDNHKNSVRNYFVLHGAGHDQADEGLQEVFSRLWEKRETIRSDRNLRPFLLVVARNYLINEIRKNRRVEKVENLDLHLDRREADPADSLQEKDIKDVIMKAVMSLPEVLRDALILTRFENLTYREAAGVLGVAFPTVGERVSKAYDKLQRELASLVD